MKITNNQGPNKEPRGTPDRIAHHVQFIPSMTTLGSHSKRTGDTKITHFLQQNIMCHSVKSLCKDQENNAHLFALIQGL